MSQYLCAKTYKLLPATLRGSLLGVSVLAAMAVIGSSGCESKAIGRSCDVLTDAAPPEGVYNSEALDCPSRICLKPVVATTAPPIDPPTTAYCSAGCSQDSDCSGEVRTTVMCPSPDDKTKCPASGKCPSGGTCIPDTRCSLGFTCGVPFVKGKLCCQKVCVCKDFLPTTGESTPKACSTPDDIKLTCGSTL